jgi:N-formylglutamate deformylase
VKKLIFHIPHASTHIPDDVRHDLSLSNAALAEELRVLTDHFTDKLFSGLARLTDFVVKCPVSRLVVDVERFVDDALEPMHAQGMGAVYSKTHNGGVLRTSMQSRDSLLQRYYNPHHTALHQAVETHLSEQGEAVIIDCHSFPECALPYESNQALHRPEICLGTDDVHTSEALLCAVELAYRAADFEVSRNTPFAGALVPLAHYGRDKRVQSVMIEIRRDVYMDEKTTSLKSDLSHLQRANEQAINAARNSNH